MKPICLIGSAVTATLFGAYALYKHYENSDLKHKIWVLENKITKAIDKYDSYDLTDDSCAKQITLQPPLPAKYNLLSTIRSPINSFYLYFFK